MRVVLEPSRWLTLLPQLRPSEFVTLVGLALAAKQQPGVLVFRTKDLLAVTGLSRPLFQVCLRSLEDRGLLQVEWCRSGPAGTTKVILAPREEA